MEWDADNQRWLPAQNQLQFDPELSTYWREHLAIHDQNPEVLLADNLTYTLVGEWEVEAVRQLHFPVEHSPTGEKPPDCAHTSVYWPPDSLTPSQPEPSKAKRRALRGPLAARMTWVYGEITTTPPEGA